jgi:hypothetical protein
LAVVVVLGVFPYVGAGVSGDCSSASCRAVVEAISLPSDTALTPCEPASGPVVSVSGNGIVSLINLKEFHDHIDNPVTENRIVEQRNRFFFLNPETSRSPVNLSRLQRLNI